jgi:probable rRNA maturation factor
MLAIAFVDDDAMRALNARYRRKDRTTDVLSFGQTAPRRAKGAAAVARLRREADGSLEVGDVVISVPQARRQARRKGHPLWREIAFLAAHGALHLVGFEDTSRAGYREMVALGTVAVAKASKNVRTA